MSIHDDEPGSATPTDLSGSRRVQLPIQDGEEQPFISGTNSLASSFFVGSPDQFESESERQTTPRATSNILGLSNSAPRTRPTLGTRNVSTPLISRRRAMSSNHRAPSAVTNLRLNPNPSEQRWTLFGQLMENEGQLPTPGVRRRPSVHPDQHTSFNSSLDGTSSRQGNADPFLEEESVAELDGHPSSRCSSRAPSFHAAAATAYHSQGQDQDTFSDSDSDSSDSESSDESPTTPISPAPLNLTWHQRIPKVPIVYRNVLKCALAYFIASLFTFNPVLADLISKITTYGPGPREPFQGGHMVATIAVFYNPAKTQGGMIEADVFCLVGLLYAAFVCLSSMSMFWWLELSPGWEWLGDLVAILWIGVSMSVVSWFKVWMANTSFNTACSMTAIITFVVIVKEGGMPTLLQVSTVVVCGSLISNLVCYVIWPQSAIHQLQANMTNTLNSFSTVLNMLTNTFLLEGGSHKKLNIDKMQRAVEDHQSSFTSLKKNFVEARTEWPLRGDSPGSRPEDTGKRAYEDAIDSLNRLGQHLNGLRSGTRLQYELTRAGVLKHRSRKNKRNANRAVGADLEVSVDDDEETAMLKAAAAMFGDIVDDLGPPLKALSNACITSLKRLREAFEQSQSTKRKKGAFRTDEFHELVDGIEQALVRFESTSNHAVLRLYRKSDVPSSPRPASLTSYRMGSAFSSKEDDTDNALLLGADNEQVFLVYFFIFTLQEYAREVVSLIDAMGRIYRYEQARLHQRQWWRRIYRGICQCLSRPSTAPKRKYNGLKRTFSSYIIPDIRHPSPTFPKVRPHAPNTMQTPSSSNLSFIGRIKFYMWKVGHRMTERDTKYAFKVGMAIAIFAAPAFYDSTRPYFVDYWGDWALISFFAVISPTIGATNNLGLQRVLGTLFGAVVAVGIFSLYPDSPTILAVFGFLFSLPCFYYAVAHPQYLSASRFVLLTYNLSCLYCYNLRQKDLSVVDVATHRAIAVTAGVLWAAFISRFWWPAEARRELGKALGEFCLNIGWLYTRLVASNSFAPEYRTNSDEHQIDESSSSLIPTPSQSTKLNNSIKEFMAMELHLQIKLIELQGLLAQTAHEPRLKGPFPIVLYRGILASLQTILDKLHSMRCVTTREEWYTSVRQDFIVPVNRERHEMVGNIILYLSTLASAFRLKAPLPPYLPPVERTRQRLVDAIRKLDVVKNRNIKGSRQLLFFAYALTMKGVTEELESLGQTLQTAFGVIGESPEDFEALFMYPEMSRRRIDEAA